MEQTAGQIIKRTATLPTTRWSETHTTLSANLRQRGQMVVERFGNAEEFKMKVNPDTQVAFGRNYVAAVTGDYPTLKDLDIAYGHHFSAEWMIPHLVSVAMFTGAKNLTKPQLRELAMVMSAEYSHLKVTEILLFFYRFKTGHYGRFYGSVDPMVITCAFREFMLERSEIIRSYESEQTSKKIEQELHDPGLMTREEFEEIRMLERMYEMQINR